MAVTFNGTGTTFYGECEWRPDGSFRTTKWFVIVYVPLIPLKSYRLARNPKSDIQAVVFSSTGFVVLEALPLDFAQVLRTYLFAVAVVGWAVFSGWVLLRDFGNHNWPWLADAALVLGYGVNLSIPFIVLWWMRRRAMARALASAVDNRWSA
jgi:hypothetical protein